MGTTIKIMQLNVGSWKKNQVSVNNAINQGSFDTILMNEHGVVDLWHCTESPAVRTHPVLPIWPDLMAFE